MFILLEYENRYIVKTRILNIKLDNCNIFMPRILFMLIIIYERRTQMIKIMITLMESIFNNMAY